MISMETYFLYKLLKVDLFPLFKYRLNKADVNTKHQHQRPSSPIESCGINMAGKRRINEMYFKCKKIYLVLTGP